MKQYLTFSADSITFGLESVYVREIFPLPALQTLAEAPGDVIGLLDLRGSLTPVIHLGKRLGLSTPSCRLQDSVIIIQWQGLQVGLVVSLVHDVQDIADASISDAPDLSREEYVNTSLVKAFAQLEDRLLTLLHPESLIRQAEDVAVLAWEAKLEQAAEKPEEADAALDAPSESLPQDFYQLCGALTEFERQTFERRAQELRAPIDDYDISDLEAITIVSIEGEYLGLRLASVREFIHLPRLTRIPCSPPQVMGNFNLRGEIMPLIDISSALELSPSDKRVKAVVFELDRQRVGISVDEVHDVLYLAQEDYLTFPATVSSEHQKFLVGAFDYQGHVVRLLD
ncbi:MAG: chemotaxis protein CheW, partial [Cyanobacteria bacterium P01_F01_bin.42]